MRVTAITEAAFLALLSFSAPAFPASAHPPRPITVSTESMERHWLKLEIECRGGAHSDDDSVCAQRDRLITLLERRGVCWAYSDPNIYPPDYRWHPCRVSRP